MFSCSSSMHLLLHVQNTHRQVSFQNPKKVPIKNEKRLPCQQIISRLKTTSRVYWLLLRDCKIKCNPASTNLEGRLLSSSKVPKPRHDNLKLLPQRHPFSHPAAAVVARGPTVSGVLQQTSSKKFRQIPSAWCFANILGKCLKHPETHFLHCCLEHYTFLLMSDGVVRVLP